MRVERRAGLCVWLIVVIGCTTGSVERGDHATLDASARDAQPSARDGGIVGPTVDGGLDSGARGDSAVGPPRYQIPDLDDERRAYERFGWTWDPSAEPSFPADPDYAVPSADIHYDTEADDLWLYEMAHARTGENGYRDRADAWAAYDTHHRRGSEDYELDAGFLYDHIVGRGLLARYARTGDEAARAAAEAMGADVEARWSARGPDGIGWPTPGEHLISYYSVRAPARHLILFTALAEATGEPRWIDARDRLVELFVASPDWDGEWGMYFDGDWATDYTLGSGSHDSGWRITSTFILGILAEALYYAYSQTGDTRLRDKLVAMARFVHRNGVDEATQYAGSFISIDPGGNVLHRGVGDPSMTTALVNSLVFGYKLTGDVALFEKAKTLFLYGNGGTYGSTEPPRPDTVRHFVDTQFDSSHGDFYFAYNKGELMYVYMLFENGGAPLVEP